MEEKERKKKNFYNLQHEKHQLLANRIKMGKKVEKNLKEKNQSAVSHDEDDPNKTPEPYNCNGHFQTDFTELCRRNAMAVIPPVVLRAKPPTLMSQAESSKPDKGSQKGKQAQAQAEPEPEVELDEEGDPPPKTYTLKDKFEYFKPSVQVEMENPDKLDTVTEIYVRGWKVDEMMMNVFKQCWSTMEKLHTINFWNTGLTGEVLSIMASTLPHIVNLRNLVLDGNPVKEENWHELISEESPVQNLSLRYCGITDKGAEHLGSALGQIKKSNTKLVSLNLAGNHISDSGMEHIAIGLRMNRTLLSLSLASNQIGDRGAVKLGEPSGSRRAESRDRPGSVRSSSHAEKDKGNKQKPSAKKKDVKGGKDAKEEEKHDKTKGKKDKDEKGGTKKESKGGKDKTPNVGGRSSGASIAADTKTAGKGKGKGGKDKGKPTHTEPEDSSGSDFVNPLTDAADFIDGQLWVSGNRMLINLNLSRNKIGEKNDISEENEIMKKLNDLMLPKDPYYKPPPQTPDAESNS
ncbi:hypothetical protein KUTeg_010790 [Tegillarca granosa]|uniref:Leucine-rich repeat-containing protein 71 n=1 Tax=Tegillarca granosa TaxID=220873 RepID=A0ABQ9F215_TEGGR|nr:hypothetical protein KUTeg_010790 [Tegillarca granosa]